MVRGMDGGFAAIHPPHPHKTMKTFVILSVAKNLIPFYLIVVIQNLEQK